MSSRIRLVDITKLKKSSWFVQSESQAALHKARADITRQEEFLESVGMDKHQLRAFINGEQWSAAFKHKAREELLRFSDQLKQEMTEEASAKRKELGEARRLLSSRKKARESARRRRTGFV
ncbi:hypothetical protein EOPP23_03500 [Endozoicomonas sp. OPT23]|uniref:hypothetical protein n=1 Tax=Endozoicomonas sp. OPT23 TaxID=2072845 RepID=UPI00129B1712|nr:hypothetical protein [Endozoicomonas sp. OPT23]MRI32065.1 hypothetical protein [Endozoicomonas sp. OPT23]